MDNNTLPADVLANVNAEIESSMNQIVAKVNGRDVTRRELRDAFKRVENPHHWKNRIDATIDATSDEELLMIREAVIFFTGSVPTFERVGSIVVPGVIGFSVMGARVRVRAAGYFATCGA